MATLLKFNSNSKPILNLFKLCFKINQIIPFQLLELQKQEKIGFIQKKKKKKLQ